MSGLFGLRVRPWLGLLAVAALPTPRSEAGGEDCCPPRGPAVVTPAARVVVARRPRGPLGTFYPTPYLYVRTFQSGSGYSPLDQYGDTSMALYGPLSALRQTSAPVMTYTRGYDGRAVLAPGTSFSTPNYPALSPVVYPTQANPYYGPRRNSTPPQWQNATNWIDQN